METATKKKRVVVVGAGLIGTLSAYWLARSGKYQVICIDKGGGPASATSKANAGRFCPSLLGDFAPKMQALKSLMRPSTSSGEGGVGKVEWSPWVVSWGVKYIQSATFRRTEINSVLDQMGQLSTRLMSQILSSAIRLETITPNVWVYPSDDGIKNGKSTLEKTPLARYRQLSSEECSALTSISKSALGITGGCLSVESDYTANAWDFTARMAEASESLGAEFRYNTRVESLVRAPDGTLEGVKLDDGTRIQCDYAVIASGPWSNQLAKKWIGLSLPIMPVRGASITLLNVKNNPAVGFSDNGSGDVHFQATPYGNSLRLAGFAEVVADPNHEQVEIECSSRYRDAFIARLKVVLPQVTWEGESAVWCGLRPVTPDRLPFIGPTQKQGVFLNTGHGAVGWTLAAASGYLLCASMLKHDGHKPLGVDQEGDTVDVAKTFGLARFWGL